MYATKLISGQINEEFQKEINGFLHTLQHGQLIDIKFSISDYNSHGIMFKYALIIYTC